MDNLRMSYSFAYLFSFSNICGGCPQSKFAIYIDNLEKKEREHV